MTKHLSTRTYRTQIAPNNCYHELHFHDSVCPFDLCITYIFCLTLLLLLLLLFCCYYYSHSQQQKHSILTSTNNFYSIAYSLKQTFLTQIKEKYKKSMSIHTSLNCFHCSLAIKYLMCNIVFVGHMQVVLLTKLNKGL